jgi:hypothetical protein
LPDVGAIDAARVGDLGALVAERVDQQVAAERHDRRQRSGRLRALRGGVRGFGTGCGARRFNTAATNKNAERQDQCEAPARVAALGRVT